MKNKINKILAKNTAYKNYKRMWPFIKPYSLMGILGIILVIPVGSLDAAVAMYLRPFMDNVMLDKQPSFSMTVPLLIIGFTVVQGIFNYSASYVNTWVGSKITISLKRRLYDKLLSMDTSYFDKSDSGTILLRYYNDADLAAGGLINNMKLFLSKFFSSAALVFVLFYNSIVLALLAVGVLVFIVYPLNIVRKKTTDITNQSLGMNSSIMTVYNETFGGNKVIHAYNLEESMKKRYIEYTDIIFAMALKMVQHGNWLAPCIHVISSVGIALVIGTGSYLIAKGSITTGSFVSFIAALIMLYTPMRSIGHNYVEIQRSFLAIDRIFSVLDQTPKTVSNNGTIELKKISGEIEFKNVCFEYIENIEILKGISFSIKAGETVAFVGPSGGGKTTITSLLPRLYEVTKGEILIDGININDYTVESLRKNISVVFQDNFLFSGTIRENILLGRPDAAEEDIWEALKHSYLDTFVKSLPKGLDTAIGERGILLSGGQRQRIGIARAFLKNANVVILDEATSSLDNKAETIVQQALDNLMKDRTVIVIAHRLSTIRNADKILVVSDGMIIEEGHHEDLIAVSHGHYYALYHSQFRATA